MKKVVLVILSLTTFAYGVTYWILNTRDPLLKWDWSVINTSNKSFPKSFVWGAASAAHQVEGGH